MVRASGKNRQLPSGRVPRVCLAEGARPGGHAAVLEQGVGEGQEAAEEVWRSRRDSLSHAARTCSGDSGRGRRPQVPYVRMDRWCAALPESAWTTIDVRDGAKGPLVVQTVKTRVQAKTDRRRNGPEELLVVVREEQSDGTMKHDYHLSNAAPETPLAELTRVVKAEHRIEECLERAKGEAGLAQYQVRNWRGWHHHQTLSLLAAWFLTQEDMRGKKIHPGADGPPRSHHPGLVAQSRPRLRFSGLYRAAQHAGDAAERVATVKLSTCHKINCANGGPVILSAAKNLPEDAVRSFAALRMTFVEM